MKLFRHKFRNNKKSYILLLADVRGWAFDHSAKQIQKELSKYYHIDIEYVKEKPNLKAEKYDLVFVFFWGESYYKRFNFSCEQIIKQVSSHRWEIKGKYGPLPSSEFVRTYLRDTNLISVTSLLLHTKLKNSHPLVFHTPNGYNSKIFYNKHNRKKNFVTFGWAGNRNEPLKQYNEIIEPLSKKFNFRIASGNLPHRKMNKFYNSIDVFLVSSKYEGEPLTLIEAMAAGCFPVCSNVGIVSELIQNGENGLIVKDTSINSFNEALLWCEKNIDYIRKKGKENAELMKQNRSWNKCAIKFKTLFQKALERKNKPKFRNDDVSFETNLDNFKKFCELFHKYNLNQIHGITLKGRTHSLFLHNEKPVEYENKVSLAYWSNEQIMKYSEKELFEERNDIIKFINSIPDEIALHGLYHTDYSVMEAAQQRRHINIGLKKLETLFPEKLVRYFIAPFNRTNSSLFKVCKEFDLEVLHTNGTHLESTLDNNKIKTGMWYRYHHHRFYPASKYNYHVLNFQKLEKFLSTVITNENSISCI